MMNIIWRISLMKIIFLTSCCALPIYEMEPHRDIKKTESIPIITSPCTPNDRCWGWYRGKNVPVFHSNKSTFQRNVNGEQDGVQWKPLSPGDEDVADMRSRSPVIRQVSNKSVKKDVFMSRSWGAGGMPFSVLYMNPHGSRTNHPPTPDTPKTSSESSRKSTEPPLVTSKHTNNRVTLRNGTSQPRKQYSIIPQLFISYGWGPFGK